MVNFDCHENVTWGNLLDSEEFLISQVIKRRNIRWLCHFTPRENLENIRRNGLKTRDLLSSRDSCFTDQARFDRYRNAICLSISKPNIWMFNRKKEQGFDLCLLLINPEILYKKNCLFYPYNAATASFRNIDINLIKGDIALEKMFANTISFQKSGGIHRDIPRYNGLSSCETTSEQAEVQCLENIEPEHILRIYESNIPLTYEDIKQQFEKKNNILSFESNLDFKLDFPPIDLDFPPIDLDLPPIDLDLQPIDLDLPPIDLDLPPIDLDFPPIDLDFPPIDLDLPPIDLDFPPIDLDLPPIDLDSPSILADKRQSSQENFCARFNEMLNNLDSGMDLNSFGESKLSRLKAERDSRWIELEKAYEENSTVIGLIKGKVKGGFTVDLNYVSAFLPGSLVDTRPVREADHLFGKELEFKVIKCDQNRNNVVVSRRAVIESENSQEREKILENLAEGSEVKGIVKNLTDYGAFVDLGGVTGLLHITDMAWKRVETPSEVVNVGDEINVKVLKLDKARARITLGLKQLDLKYQIRSFEKISIRESTDEVSNLAGYASLAELEVESIPKHHICSRTEFKEYKKQVLMDDLHKSNETCNKFSPLVITTPENVEKPLKKVERVICSNNKVKPAHSIDVSPSKNSFSLGKISFIGIITALLIYIIFR